MKFRLWLLFASGSLSFGACGGELVLASGVGADAGASQGPSGGAAGDGVVGAGADGGGTAGSSVIGAGAGAGATAGSSGSDSCGAFCDGDPRTYLGPVTPEGCRKNPLANPWPVIAGCASGELPNSTLRCPHPFQSNTPDYGPFVACCPLEMPYSCPNGTPNGCFADAQSAFAFCNESCVECSLP
jgi:hypothetical protein